MFLCIVRHAIRPIAVLSNKQTVHNVTRFRLYVCTAHRAFVVNKRRMVLDLLYVLFFACIVIYYEFIVFSCFGVFAVQFGDIWTIWHWRKKNAFVSILIYFTNYIYFLTPIDRSSLAKFWIYLWLFIDFQFTKYTCSFFTFIILTVSISLAANQRSQKSIKNIQLCISRLLPTTNIQYSVAKCKIIKYSDLHRWFGYYFFNILVAAI